MNKIKSFVVMIFISLLCCQISRVDVFAAGLSASANTSSITIGSSFKVTVTASDCAAFSVSASTSNGSVSGGSSSLDTEGGGGSKSTTFTVKPSSVGTCTVIVKGEYAAYSGNSADASFSKTINVTVNAAQANTPTPTPTPQKPAEDNRSKENSLSSLSVSDGTLSPAFSASTTKYSVSLDSSKSAITINAKAKDSKATVSGTGEKKLNIGDNELSVKCTAENGSSKTYTIVVHVDETPTNFTEFQDKKLGVVKNLKDIKVPTSFDETTTKLNDQEVIAWFSPDLNLTICYLSDESGKKDFYIIEDGKITSIYQVVSIDGKNYVVLTIDEKQQKRDGFIYQEVTIQDYKLNGWIYQDESFKDYIQVYLMNDQGKKHIYDYEISEGQLQIYTEQVQKKSGINIFMITTGVFVLTSGGLLYLYLSFKKKSISAIKEYYQNKGQ